MKIFKSRIVKRVLGVLIVVGCSGIFLNGYVGVSDSVYAANDSTITNGGYFDTGGGIDTMGLWQIMDMILKVIYLLLWPLLVVAGLALDNTLVYASIFHLDAPLWKFWNMMKNFANFALGFMVLFAIVKSLVTGGGAGSVKDEKTPLGIIKTTLIAGILIQASWFLMAAMIDVSTIATYAVGGLPLSVLKNTDIGNQKILSVNSAIDLNKFDVLSPKGEGFKVWYSTIYKSGDKRINVQLSPCRIEKSYVVGRQYSDLKYRNSDIFGSGQSACVASNQIVIYNEFPNVADKDGISYHDELNRILNMQPDWGTREACYYVINTSGKTPDIGECSQAALDVIIENGVASGYNDISGFVLPLNTTAATLGMSGGYTWFNSNNVIAMTISDLITKSKGFVGPLVTMYSSLLNFAQLTDTNVTNTSGTSGIFIIKSLVAIALFFPLLALAVVLIARIGVLWLYIVASPLIVLKAVFKDFIKMGAIDDYFKIEQVAGIIFAPVITVAALSISLIFMTALVNGFNSKDVATTQQIHESLGIQTLPTDNKNHDLISVEGITQLEFSKIGGEVGDWFSRFMVNFFAIGLMWMLVFAAIKANKLGQFIEEKVGIQKFGENFFSTLPIIQVPGMEGRIGLGTAANGIRDIPGRYVDKLEHDQTKIVDDFTGLGTDNTGAGNTAPTFSSEATKIATSLGAGKTMEKAAEEAKLTIPASRTQEDKSALYEAIDKMDDTKKTTAIKGFEQKLGAGTYEIEKKLAIAKSAKTEFEKIVNITSENDDTAKLQTIVNDNNNKTIVEKLFAADANGYVKNIGNTKFTVTINTDTKATNKYVVKKEPIKP